MDYGHQCPKCGNDRFTTSLNGLETNYLTADVEVFVPDGIPEYEVLEVHLDHHGDLELETNGLYGGHETLTCDNKDCRWEGRVDELVDDFGEDEDEEDQSDEVYLRTPNYNSERPWPTQLMVFTNGHVLTWWNKVFVQRWRSAYLYHGYSQEQAIRVAQNELQSIFEAYQEVCIDGYWTTLQMVEDTIVLSQTAEFTHSIPTVKVHKEVAQHKDAIQEKFDEFVEYTRRLLGGRLQNEGATNYHLVITPTDGRVVLNRPSLYETSSDYDKRVRVPAVVRGRATTIDKDSAVLHKKPLTYNSRVLTFVGMPVYYTQYELEN